MRLEHTIRYHAEVDAVATMLADPDFRVAVCDALGCQEAEVEVSESSTGYEVVVDQLQTTDDLPSFARAFSGPTTRAIQRETWEDLSARVAIETPGKPASMSGTITLQSDGEATIETIKLDIGIKVPLIGGKLEKLMVEKVLAGYEVEGRVGEAWLSGE